MQPNKITETIINAACKVHTALGRGLLESAYKQCLAYELRKMGLKAEVEVPIDLVYEDLVLDNCYRMDILVENEIVLEIKSVSDLADIHTAQMITYLKLAHKKLGLLLNFNVKSMTQGIKRIVYTHTPSFYKHN